MTIFCEYFRNGDYCVCRHCQQPCEGERECPRGDYPGRVSAGTGKLSAAELAELMGDADPTLFGNRLAAMIAAIGIPPCGGCHQRREWLNRAHAWLREAFT